MRPHCQKLAAFDLPPQESFESDLFVQLLDPTVWFSADPTWPETLVASHRNADKPAAGGEFLMVALKRNNRPGINQPSARSPVSISSLRYHTIRSTEHLTLQDTIQINLQYRRNYSSLSP